MYYSISNWRRSTKRQPSDQMDAWRTEATGDQECHGKFVQKMLTFGFNISYRPGCHVELPDQEEPQPGGGVPRRDDHRRRGAARRAREHWRWDQEVRHRLCQGMLSHSKNWQYMITELRWRTTRRQPTMGSPCCRLSSTLRTGFPLSMTTISQRCGINIAMSHGKIIITLYNIIYSYDHWLPLPRWMLTLENEANVNIFRLDIFRGDFLDSLFYGR